MVDDDPGARSLFRDILVSNGYRVALASTGEEALAYLHLITPDLVLLDLALPGIDGRGVANQIKMDTTKPFMPIIMLSAHTELSASVMSLDAGADDFLPKPIDIDELLAHVRAMLRLQRAQRDLSNEQRKTELLLHLTRELGASIELDVLLTRFLDHLADAVGAIRASIILVDYDDEHTLCYSSSRNPATPILSDILRHGVAGWVLHERLPLVVPDTYEDDRWVSKASFQKQVRSVAAMPVLREGRVLGVITLVHHTPGYFTSEHTDLLGSVAAQSAVALESARLFRLTQRQKELLAQRADELRRINEINSHLSELMYPDQLIRLAVHMVQQQFEYPRVSMMLHENDHLTVKEVAGAIDMPSFDTQPMRFPITQGINGWAVRHRQIVRSDDVTNDERFLAASDAGFGIRSELVVPILLRREVFGTIDVQSEQPNAFGPNDEAVLSAIVSQLSVALGNALLLENEQRRIQQLSQVNRLSVAITAQLDATQSLQLAADAVAMIFGARQTALILFGEAEDHGSALVALYGLQTDADNDLFRYLHSTNDIQWRIQQIQSPRIYRSMQTDQRFAELQTFLKARAIESVLLVPLVASSHTLGIIAIDATRRENDFGSADLELATTVASLIMQVIENIRLYRVVEDERSTLNAVLGGTANPIVLAGPENELLLANRAAEERLTLKLETHHNTTLQSLAQTNPNPLLERLIALLTDTVALAAPKDSYELSLPSDTTYSVNISPVRGADGQPLGKVAVMQDITAIKVLERQERERMRSVFRRYVSPVVAERLMSASQEFGQPTECDVAVLFADMRGFTALTEQTNPKVLVELILNRYFTTMTEVLHEHEGTIDKFLGDGIIGVFGTPIARPDDPQRALITAVDMQKAFTDLNAIWRKEVGLDIGMGIGISYGRAVVGNIGSEQRLDYTLIGDVVNTASRLSGLAKADQIIISYHLCDALPDNHMLPVHLKPLGQVHLKGKQEPHRIYEVVYENHARHV